MESFTSWYVARHGVDPEKDPTEAIATEWLECALPGTTHMVSPHRVEYQLALMSDWIADEVTDAARALLPEWVRWNGEQSGISEPHVDAAVAVAAGGTRSAADCPVAR